MEWLYMLVISLSIASTIANIYTIILNYKITKQIEQSKNRIQQMTILRDCGEAGHDEGKCGNESCIRRYL